MIKDEYQLRLQCLLQSLIDTEWFTRNDNVTEWLSDQSIGQKQLAIHYRRGKYIVTIIVGKGVYRYAGEYNQLSDELVLNGYKSPKQIYTVICNCIKTFYSAAVATKIIQNADTYYQVKGISKCPR